MRGSPPRKLTFSIWRLMSRIPVSQGKQTAVLAGGCFWGVEAVFEHLKGVSNVVSGFAGGDKSTAQYETVSWTDMRIGEDYLRFSLERSPMANC